MGIRMCYHRGRIATGSCQRARVQAGCETMRRMANAPHTAAFRLCFVCTGNTCRSPMAEAVFRDLAQRAGIDRHMTISSAGTGEWHVGEKADPRTREALAKRGYSADHHRAKQFDTESFDELDLIVTFDRTGTRILGTWAESDEQRGLIRPISTLFPEGEEIDEILDPYYGDADLFDEVLRVIEAGCRHLLAQIEPVVRVAAAAQAASASAALPGASAALTAASAATAAASGPDPSAAAPASAPAEPASASASGQRVDGTAIPAPGIPRTPKPGAPSDASPAASPPLRDLPLQLDFGEDFRVHAERDTNRNRRKRS